MLFLLVICNLQSAICNPKADAQERRGRYTPGLVLETGARHAICDVLTFTPSGDELLAAGDDKVVRIWPVDAEKLRRDNARVLRWPTFREAAGSIYALALYPGKSPEQLVIGGHGGLYPGLLVVLDRKTGAVRHALTRPLTRDVTWTVDWSPDAKHIVFGTEGGEVFRWTPGEESPVAFAGSPSKRENRIRLVSFLDRKRFLCVSRDGRILELDVENPKKPARELGTFSNKALITVAVSPDGRWLAGGGENVTGDESIRTDQVELFDLARLRTEGTVHKSTINIPQGKDVTRMSSGLAFDKEGKRLAVGTRDARHLGMDDDPFARVTGGHVFVWSLAGGKPTPLSRQGLDVGYRVYKVAFRPGHPTQLATADGPNHEVRLWDYTREDGPLDLIRSPGSCLWSVAMSTDGKYLAWQEKVNTAPRHPNERGTGPWRVFTLDRKARTILSKPPADFRPVRPLTEQAGWRVVTTERGMVWGVEGPGADGRIAFTELSDRTGLYLTAVNQVPRCYTFLPPRDKTGPVRLAIGHMWGVSIYELAPGRVRLARLMHGHESEVMGVAPSHDGRLLLTASRDQTIACWSLEDWPSQRELGASFAPGVQGDGTSPSTSGEGKVMVRHVDPGSPAWEAGLTDGDEVVMVVSIDRDGKGGFVYDPEKLGLAKFDLRLKNPRFVNRRTVLENLSEAETAREYIFVWRHKGEKDLQVRMTTVRQRPLWRFFPTRAEEGGNWILWRWRDFYYDTQDPHSDRLVGWQVQYRDPKRRPDFYPLAALGGTDELDKKKEWVGLHNPARVWKFVKLPAQDPQKVLFPEIEPPSITLTVAQNPTGTRDLILLASVRPNDRTEKQKLKRIVLWLDDTLFDVPDLDPRTAKVDPKTGAIQARITIPRARLRQGPNEITLVAYNAEGARGQDKKEVDYIDLTRPKPNLYGLCVGINDYSKARNFEGLNNLNYARPDAEAVAKVLGQHNKSRLFERSKVELMTEPEATAPRILARLRQLGKQVGPDDWLVLFLSGHGFGTDTPGSFFYVCADTDAVRRETRLTGAQLYEALREVRGRKLLLLDTCKSGSVVSPPIQSLNRDGVKFLIFTACKPDQPALEPGPGALLAHRDLRKHGLFTQALLQALGHPDQMGKTGRQKPVTARYLADNVQETIRKLLPKLGMDPDDQVPEFVPDRREMPRVEVLSRP